MRTPILIITLSSVVPEFWVLSLPLVVFCFNLISSANQIGIESINCFVFFIIDSYVIFWSNRNVPAAFFVPGEDGPFLSSGMSKTHRNFESINCSGLTSRHCKKKHGEYSSKFSSEILRWLHTYQRLNIVIAIWRDNTLYHKLMSVFFIGIKLEWL